MRDLPSGTVTFLFTDIEGSTRLMHELGDESYAVALAEHRSVVRDSCRAHGGVEVDTQGDAFFVVFPDATEAVAASQLAQATLAAGPIQVRMGLHTGTARVTAEGYVGTDVHLGARIAAAGHGGQVLLSRATRELVDVDTCDLGEHRLKDFDKAIQIFQLGADGFPPLKTISNTNLPRPASLFVGRQREVGQVVSLLRGDERLVTLTGPGGSGKTRLAIESATELVPDFKSGVFWVGLATLRDPALVMDAVAQTLGAKEELAEHIGERELLLLLDNLEQVIEAAPEIAALVEACPNVCFLVTSRELLRVRGEAQYSVPPLVEREAVELFCSRARLAPEDAIVELCRRLDNLPLAVELAAARTTVLSPVQILERLTHRLDLLKGGRDAEIRQRTLRAAIAWSHDLLTEEEKEVFRRLSVFEGGCTVEAAEDIAEADLDATQSLIEKSLARQSHSRIWMLETIREYALERLQESRDHERISQRHAEHYLALAESVAADESGRDADGMQELEDDHDNIRAARTWFHDAGKADAELRMVCALAGFWDTRGHLREGYSSVVEALENDAPQSPALRARALAAASDFARLQGAVEEATRYSEESLNLFRELGDDAGIARALHELGENAAGQEAYDQAAELFEQAIAASQAVGNDAAGSIANLGWVALLRGDYQRAAELSEEALERFRRRGHLRGSLVVLENLAEAELALGRREAGSRHLRECLELAIEAQFFEVIAGCLETAAQVLIDRGDAETAARLVGAEDSLLQQINLTLHPAERRRREYLRSRLQTLLGASATEFGEERTQMTLDEATSLALVELDASASAG